VPQHLKGLIYGTYALCILISCLGITLTCLWLFGCEPFVSNFLWSVLSTECLNPDIIRWRECYTFPLIENLLLISTVWVGVSIPIDAILVIIPLQYVRLFVLLLLMCKLGDSWRMLLSPPDSCSWERSVTNLSDRILKRAKLRSHERRILKLVFSATLLGTITCITGIYGIYEYRLETANDSFYREVVFLMIGTLEIFMYALGASFPGTYTPLPLLPPQDLHNI
jgi:hypothetical protein